MSNIFITGMGRSGTTLLEKLLNSHSQISILSQPFPLLYTNLKKEFLKKKGIEKYYVLNDSLQNSNYDIKEFNDFVKNKKINKKNVLDIFESMKNYSGQKMKINLDVHISKKNSFFILFRNLLKNNSTKNNSKYFGSKEILCEDFLPSMLKEGIKTIIIIRDPRDVLASANYPKGEKYLGNKKPTLFLLRSWRKSVEFARYLQNNKNFHFLKYEDLVKEPYKELNKITKFLKISNFDKNYFDKGIFDQNGKLWSANSSFDAATSFISQRSVGAYKKVLSNEEIAYTDAVCKKEMEWLVYKCEKSDKSQEEIIRNFKDFGIKENSNLSANFSSQKKNIEYEISRLDT